MKILVTGGGVDFIGSHLCECLLIDDLNAALERALTKHWDCGAIARWKHVAHEVYEQFVEVVRESPT